MCYNNFVLLRPLNGMEERHGIGRRETDLATQVAEAYANGGRVVVYNEVDRSTADFRRILACAQFFARQGRVVVMPPKVDVPYKNPAYDKIYGTLKGTPYYGKCPDLCVDGVWYEHEGYVHDNPKSNFANMCKRGLRQSDRIIVEDCGLTDGYMKRNILVRIHEGQCIMEFWVKDKTGLRLLYKAE